MNALSSVLEAAPAAPASVDPLGDWVRAAQAGDRAATERLLERLSPALLAIVRRILSPAHPAIEDVLQETLVALVKALPAFRGESSLSTYAARIAVRTALATSRQARDRKAWDEEHERAEAPLAPDASTPELELQAARRRAALRSLLAELPPAQAETFTLRIVLDYSLEEVARATGVPENTVRSRMRLAREALRARIEAEPELARAFGGNA